MKLSTVISGLLVLAITGPAAKAQTSIREISPVEKIIKVSIDHTPLLEIQKQENSKDGFILMIKTCKEGINHLESALQEFGKEMDMKDKRLKIQKQVLNEITFKFGNHNLGIHKTADKESSSSQSKAQRMLTQTNKPLQEIQNNRNALVNQQEMMLSSIELPDDESANTLLNNHSFEFLGDVYEKMPDEETTNHDWTFKSSESFRFLGDTYAPLPEENLALPKIKSERCPLSKGYFMFLKSCYAPMPEEYRPIVF